MKFTSQIATTPKQSKRLLELGLKPDTADCMYSVMTVSYNGYFLEEDKRHYNLCLFNQDEVQTVGFCKYEKISAWSLHRLIEMCNKTQFGMTISIYNSEVTVDGDLFEVYDNTYDNLISIIEWLIKKGHFNKEYLEEI